MSNMLENKRLMVLFLALLIVSGLGAINNLPRSEDPYVVLRQATIITQYPGASAEQVEALVTEKIERSLYTLPNVKNLMSNSKAGISIVRIELEETINHDRVQQIWSRASRMLQNVAQQFPEGVLNPTLDQDRGFAYTYIVALSFKDKGSIHLLNRYSKVLDNQLKSIAGTFLVDTFAAPEEEILLQFDPLQLATIGLNAQQVARLLQGQDNKVTAGSINNNDYQFAIELNDSFNSLDQIRQQSIRVDDQGNNLKLIDIASIERQIRLPEQSIAMINGKRAIVIGAQIEPNQRVDQWTEAVNKKIASFQQQLPDNIKVDILFEQNQYTDKRFSDLLTNIVIGFLLVIAILMVTLGFRSALVVASCLPLTILFTFSCMFYFNIPIHQISVTGLIVALGIMVDNAIVMSETISRYHAQGVEKKQAVSQAIKHLWLPLLGSTLTTAFSFLPIALMPGASGEFVGAIAYTVIFSLMGSYLISHSFVAFFTAFMLGSATTTSSSAKGINLPKLNQWFIHSLQKTLSYPKTTLISISCFCFIGFAASQLMTEQFFPVADRDMFHIEVYLPTSASIQQTQQLSQSIQDKLLTTQGIESSHWFIGNNAPSFYYNLIPDKDGTPYYAQAMVKATDFKVANKLIPQLQQALTLAFPEAKIFVQKLQQGPPFSAPIELRIIGNDLAQLEQLGHQIRQVMSTDPNITQSIATLADSSPKIGITLNQQAILAANLQPEDVAEQIQLMTNGVVIGSLLESTEEVFIRLQVNKNYRQHSQDISSLLLFPKQANTNEINAIPLAAIADLTLEPNYSAIPHRNTERINTVQAFIKEGILPATVIKRLQANLENNNFQLPAGYRLETGGESEQRNQAVDDLMLYVGVIIVLMVMVIVLSFNSYRVSVIVFAVAILSAGLGLLSVFCFGYPFGFTVIIALVGLMGLAINAAIVILAEIQADQQSHTSQTARLINAVNRCSRHIMSTTITTIAGFLPLMLDGGGFWPPFAIAIAGGTLLTTLLSFYFVPCAYQLLMNEKPIMSHAQLNFVQ